MKPVLTCAIVHDLLPLYVENLVEAQTAEAIQEHLAGCPECTRRYEAMKSHTNAPQPMNAEAPEIDYLKSVKKHNRRNVLIAVLLVIALMIGVIALNLLAIGTPATSGVYVTSEITSNAGTETLRAIMVMEDPRKDFTDVDVHISDGAAIITGREILRMPGGSGIASVSVPLEDVHTVVACGNILWSDGTLIDGHTNRLYNLRTPYVGNPSAVSALLTNMDLDSSDTLELHTDAAPYGMTIHFDHPWEEDRRVRMEHEAYVILALIDNLSWVSWDDPSGYTGSLTVSEAQEALPELIDAYNTAHETNLEVRRDLKAYAESPAALQELRMILGL